MKAVNINWDTDGENVALPEEIELPVGMTDYEEISDYLSDVTGFCHFGCDLVRSLNVTVQCMAVYTGCIDVPAHMTIEEAVKYAKEHFNEIPCGELEYISDSDVLDEENCDFAG